MTFERLIEAECFDNYGGWIMDSQFTEEMGSPYLLAHGIGFPVEDATTSVEMEEGGTYTLWVRSKDWYLGYHPGSFQILINGEACSEIFGANDMGWNWQSCTVNLHAGSNSIALHDLTGFEGRCDAIYITDSQIIPPSDLTHLRNWRKRLLHIPDQPIDHKDYDVVVVGGGVAGIAAAYTAAKDGASVALIHNSSYLGGNASKDVGLTPEGELGKYVLYLSKRLVDGDISASKILKEAGVDLYLNEEVFHAVTEERKICSVDSRHHLTGKETRYHGKEFIDCSGKAQLARLTGASLMTGTEARSTYNESLVCQNPSAMHHGHTVFFRTEMEKEKIEFPDVPWAKEISKDYCDLGGQMNAVTSLNGQGPYENQVGPYVGVRKITPVRQSDGSWKHALNLPKSHFWEYGQWMDSYTQSEEIRDHLFCAIIGTYANVREADPEKYANLKLVRLANVLATGGYARYVGDYVLTQNDIWNHTDFPDAIVTNSGAFCLHYPGNEKYDFRLGDWKWVERDFKPYTVPYRALYSKDFDNLFVAGKHISASHIASSTVKLIGNGAHHGFAVGIAASMCGKMNISNRELNQYFNQFKKKVEEYENGE